MRVVLFIYSIKMSRLNMLWILTFIETQFWINLTLKEANLHSIMYFLFCYYDLNEMLAFSYL